MIFLIFANVPERVQPFFPLATPYFSHLTVYILNDPGTTPSQIKLYIQYCISELVLLNTLFFVYFDSMTVFVLGQINGDIVAMWSGVERRGR